MNEVKMVLNVPTRTALYEQNHADDEWQTWYGRTASLTEQNLLSISTSVSDGSTTSPDSLFESTGFDDQMMII